MGDRFPEAPAEKRSARAQAVRERARRAIWKVMPPVARGFEFKLTAEADNVPIVRRALHALLVPAGFDADRIASIALATTEVCANVVRHAYPDGSRGVIRVEAELAPDGALTVVVGDHGVGADGRNGEAMASAIGLGISAAIANDLRIETAADVGTEVRMVFTPEHAKS